MIEAIEKDNAFIVVFENVAPKELEVMNNVKRFIAMQNEKPAHQITIKEYEQNKEKLTEEARKESEAHTDLQVPEKQSADAPAKKMVFSYRRNIVRDTEEKIAGKPIEVKKEEAKPVNDKANEIEEIKETDMAQSGFVRRKPQGFVYRREETALTKEFDEKQAKKREEAEKLLAIKEANDAFAMDMNPPVEDKVENKSEAKIERKKLVVKGGLKFVGNSSKSDEETKALKRDEKQGELIDKVKEKVDEFLGCPFISDEDKKEIALTRYHYDVEKKKFDENYDFSNFDMTLIEDGGMNYGTPEITDKPLVLAERKTDTKPNNPVIETVDAVTHESGPEPETEWEQMEIEM